MAFVKTDLRQVKCHMAFLKIDLWQVECYMVFVLTFFFFFFDVLADKRNNWRWYTHYPHNPRFQPALSASVSLHMFILRWAPSAITWHRTYLKCTKHIWEVSCIITKLQCQDCLLIPISHSICPAQWVDFGLPKWPGFHPPCRQVKEWASAKEAELLASSE